MQGNVLHIKSKDFTFRKEKLTEAYYDLKKNISKHWILIG